MSFEVAFSGSYCASAYLNPASAVVKWSCCGHVYFKKYNSNQQNALRVQGTTANNHQRISLCSGADGAQYWQLVDGNDGPATGGDSTSNLIPNKAGEWWFFGMAATGDPTNGTIKAWAWNPSGTKYSLGTITKYSADPAMLTYAGVGSASSGAPWSGTYPVWGEYVHFRVWSGAELTDTDFAAERTSSTAVYSSPLIDSPLASHTDTSNAGSGGTLTIAGDVATGTNYPSYITAGASGVVSKLALLGVG